MKEEKKKKHIKEKEDDKENEIITDPFGSYTGVCVDDKYARPVQDADDL